MRWLRGLLEAFPFLVAAGVVAGAVYFLAVGVLRDVGIGYLIFGGALVLLIALTAYGHMADWWDELRNR